MKHSELELQASDGLHLFAQEWAPDGELTGLICLVHSLGEHSGRYAHMAEYFSNNGLGMISYDLRGHGKSEGQRGHSPSLDVMNDDFSWFMTVSAPVWQLTCWILGCGYWRMPGYFTSPHSSFKVVGMRFALFRRAKNLPRRLGKFAL